MTKKQSLYTRYPKHNISGDPSEMNDNQGKWNDDLIHLLQNYHFVNFEQKPFGIAFDEEFDIEPESIKKYQEKDSKELEAAEKRAKEICETASGLAIKCNGTVDVDDINGILFLHFEIEKKSDKPLPNPSRLSRIFTMY